MSTDFLAGLDNDDLNTSTERLTNESIRASAHIVNGGEAQFPCPACKGSGVFRSRFGRVVGNCFKCKGTKVVSKGVAAAAKGKATKEANKIAFIERHRAELDYLTRRSEGGFRVARDLLDKWNEYGSLTENQLALVLRFMVEDDNRREGFIAKANAEREAKSGEVDVTSIQALFARAVSNDIKRPIFRTEHLTVKASKKDATVLYVTSPSDVYLGKIANGKFQARSEATETTLEQLRLIAVDPQAEAVKYGRLTSNCGCCGRGLVDPVSIRTGIGPICAEKFGFVFARENNREALAEEAQEQAARPDALPADLRAKGVVKPAPVARDTVVGAVTICREEFANAAGDRAAYVAACEARGVGRATINTQWSRIKAKG